MGYLVTAIPDTKLNNLLFDASNSRNWDNVFHTLQFLLLIQFEKKTLSLIVVRF